MAGRLQGKVAVVTGAASGIGRVIAILFAAEGARVAVLDRDRQGGEETVRSIEEKGGDGLLLVGDVSSENDVKESIGGAASSFGSLAILVNNAAIEFVGSATETSAEHWDRVQTNNLRSVFLCSKYAIPHMQQEGGGAIVNISSANALVAVPEHAAYSAAKAGIVGLTRQMALDYGPDNIRVNCICPTTTDTPMVRATMGDDELAAFARMHPLRRIAQPEDIAHAAIYLASDEASCVTGAILPVDGGWTAQ